MQFTLQILKGENSFIRDLIKNTYDGSETETLAGPAMRNRRKYLLDQELYFSESFLLPQIYKGLDAS